MKFPRLIANTLLLRCLININEKNEFKFQAKQNGKSIEKQIWKLPFKNSDQLFVVYFHNIVNSSFEPCSHSMLLFFQVPSINYVRFER